MLKRRNNACRTNTANCFVWLGTTAATESIWTRLNCSHVRWQWQARQQEPAWVRARRGWPAARARRRATAAARWRAGVVVREESTTTGGSSSSSTGTAISTLALASRNASHPRPPQRNALHRRFRLCAEIPQALWDLPSSLPKHTAHLPSSDRHCCQSSSHARTMHGFISWSIRVSRIFPAFSVADTEGLSLIWVTHIQEDGKILTVLHAFAEKQTG